MRIAFYTLGCKLNQYDTKYLEETAVSHGFTVVPFHEQAEFYVINTCTVTAKSDFHARQYIRRAKRLNPSGSVIVTGCYAQRDPAFLETLSEVDVVLGNVEKNRLFEYLTGRTDREKQVRVTSKIPQKTDTFYPLTRFPGYTRAFMKIQDGCNQACTYCIVPSVRGPSRSLDPDTLLNRFRGFLDSGYREIVLTGVHIGKYGLDLSPSMSLTKILEKLVALPGKFRIRLSSMEPPEVNNELLTLFSETSKLCHHFHIPLQSGDDTILERMKRPYTRSFYKDLIHKLKDINPAFCVGADVITGFPGETEDSFQQTFNFISSLPVSYLHVFSFSPRPGTPANDMPDKIPPEITKERTRKLRKISVRKNLEFRKSLGDDPLDVLVYDKVSPLTGLQRGLTDNYIHVHVTGEQCEVNKFHQLRILNVQSTMTLVGNK